LAVLVRVHLAVKQGATRVAAEGAVAESSPANKRLAAAGVADKLLKLLEIAGNCWK
jgi:hypothetical protein